MATTKTGAKPLTKAEEAELRRLRAADRKRKELERLRAAQAEADAADADAEDDDLDEDDDDDLDDDGDRDLEDLEAEYGDDLPVDAAAVDVREVTLERGKGAAKPKPPIRVNVPGFGSFILPLTIPVELYSALSSVPQPTGRSPQAREEHKNLTGARVIAAWIDTVLDDQGRRIVSESNTLGSTFELWASETGWGRQSANRAARRAR